MLHQAHSEPLAIDIEIVESIEEISSVEWNKLTEHRAYPFVSHEFLSCLEQHHCLTSNGWYPRHLLAWQGTRLLGAMPLYLKTNSYGEFVFDWSWAEAYQRRGGSYYPKLVSAVPFTPVTGPRLLVSEDCSEPSAMLHTLTDAAINFASDLGLSSLHCLFFPQHDSHIFERHGMITRVGCQYHWTNPGYRDFQDFLDTLTSRKRKRIKRERRTVYETGIQVDVLDGSRIDDDLWRTFYTLYCSTFYRKWSEPRLTLNFFKALARKMPMQILLFLARDPSDYVAAAFAMRGTDTLYGRHWGCTRQCRNLHFELCYYRIIEYCIEQGLRYLDAGAQGEHKLSRGFRPTQTRSAHWMRDRAFRRAVQDFIVREAQLLDEYIDSLDAHSPYKTRG
jgi:predicted N-acyltransferase